DLSSIGYEYDPASDKWNIADAAADYIYTGDKSIDFPLPGTLSVICSAAAWARLKDRERHFPLFEAEAFLAAGARSAAANFVSLDAAHPGTVQTALDIAKHPS